MADDDVRNILALTREGPVWYARPSIDALLEAAADAYGAQLIGVILTGGNEDGARGLGRDKGAGGTGGCAVSGGGAQHRDAQGRACGGEDRQCVAYRGD